MLSLTTLAKTMTMTKISAEPDENVSSVKSYPFVQLEYERSTQKLYKSFVQKDSCNFTASLHNPDEILLNLNLHPAYTTWHWKLPSTRAKVVCSYWKNVIQLLIRCVRVCVGRDTPAPSKSEKYYLTEAECENENKDADKDKKNDENEEWEQWWERWLRLWSKD